MSDSEQRYHRVDQLLTAYLKMQEHLTAAAKDFKKLKDAIEERQEVIKTELHKMCKELGTDNLKTKQGTAFLTKKDYVAVDDWEATLAFAIAPLFPGLPEDLLRGLVERSNLHYIKKGVLKNAVKDYLEETKLAVPGTKYEVERVIQIRKGK